MQKQRGRRAATGGNSALPPWGGVSLCRDPVGENQALRSLSPCRDFTPFYGGDRSHTHTHQMKPGSSASACSLPSALCANSCFCEPCFVPLLPATGDRPLHLCLQMYLEFSAKIKWGKKTTQTVSRNSCERWLGTWVCKRPRLTPALWAQDDKTTPQRGSGPGFSRCFH